MEFASVYRCLQELFPQLDARLLKAVAIENSKDADAAVEVVLSEILPRMTENENLPSPLGNLGSQNQSDEKAQEENGGSLLRHRRAFEKVNASQSNFSVNADGEASSSSVNDPAEPALINEAPFWDANDVIDQLHETLAIEEVEAPKTAEETRASSLNKISHAQLVALHHFNGAKIPDESNGTTESEELILLRMNKPPTSMRRTSYVAPSIVPNVSDSATDEGSTNEKGSTRTQAHSADHENKHCQDKNEDIFQANVVCELEPVSVQKQAPEADISEDVSAKYLNYVDTAAEASDAASALQDSANEEPLNMKRSSQIGEVDLLEQIIEDSQNKKKTLFSAMESVINTMKEVEEHERAADQAREEAARRHSDVWRRIEELKRIIQSAKEANYMHAGEIYGERAILATEVRELQSRLLSLCDERDRSLAVLDEMRNALETRLAVAEEVIKAAELEKQAKVEFACNALKEQEALMEKVVHESKVLQEEAEENTKLREFLMDRGRVVDQLQGEIAVICQDVKLLKERFDSGVALGKSISFGQTSCILASSSSSLSSSASSDRVPNNGVTYKAPSEASSGTSVDGSSPRKGPRDENATGAHRKELSDEGWELCDEGLRCHASVAQAPSGRMPCRDGEGDERLRLRNEHVKATRGRWRGRGRGRRGRGIMLKLDISGRHD